MVPAPENAGSIVSLLARTGDGAPGFPGAEVTVWNSTEYRILLPAVLTGGALSVIDCVAQPGSVMPSHVHHAEDKSFILLSGVCDFRVSGRRHRAWPGQTIFVQRGQPHAFRVAGMEPCHYLSILTPGGAERFAEMAARSALAFPDDAGRIAETAQAFRIEFGDTAGDSSGDTGAAFPEWSATG